MKLTRQPWLRYALHHCNAVPDLCGGRGWYQGEDADLFCACLAGAVRRRLDEGETVEVEWPLCDALGCDQPAAPNRARCPEHKEAE